MFSKSGRNGGALEVVFQTRWCLRNLLFIASSGCAHRSKRCGRQTSPLLPMGSHHGGYGCPWRPDKRLHQLAGLTRPFSGIVCRCATASRHFERWLARTRLACCIAAGIDAQTPWPSAWMSSTFGRPSFPQAQARGRLAHSQGDQPAVGAPRRQDVGGHPARAHHRLGRCRWVRASGSMCWRACAASASHATTHGGPRVCLLVWCRARPACSVCCVFWKALVESYLECTGPRGKAAHFFSTIC